MKISSVMLLFVSTSVLCSTILPRAGAEDASTAMVRSLLTKAGLMYGVAALPHCSDGNLALALAQNSKLLVHAMAPDRTSTDAITHLADEEGLLSRSLYVEQGSPAAMPYADNLVDLLLIADASDATLGSLSQKELLRVLAPWRGCAIIGRAKCYADGGALTVAALETWSKGFLPAHADIWSDGTGIWARISKPALDGADPWSHRYHGPNNDANSIDTTLKTPLATQWLGLPFHEGYWGTAMVGAGGRLFTLAASSHYGWTVLQKAERLTVRSAYNGAVLWEREFEAKPGSSSQLAYDCTRCCMVATPERLYLIDGDGVLMLDAETGA